MTARDLGALPVQALDHATGFAAAASILERLTADRAGSTVFALTDAASRLLNGAAAGGVGASSQDGLPCWETDLRSASSYAGQLTYVPPPVALNGTRLDYSQAPLPGSPVLPTWPGN